jgi:AraC-like DNA-binding protein
MQFSAQREQSPPLHTGRAFDRQAGLPDQAALVLEDLRRAMERNRPEGVRIAALRLVSLLTPSQEPAFARGGLAPWQRRKIDRYIRDHLARSIQIEEIAQHISLSISHFCRAFKETFGDTPHAYLIRLRLEAAQEMMLSTAEPLSQIALACGFSDQAHLSKQFRRQLGDSPSAWRRRNLTESQAASARERTNRGAGTSRLFSLIQS